MKLKTKAEIDASIRRLLKEKPQKWTMSKPFKWRKDAVQEQGKKE